MRGQRLSRKKSSGSAPAAKSPASRVPCEGSASGSSAARAGRPASSDSTAANRRPTGPAASPSVHSSGRLSASSAASVLAGLLYVAMAGPQRSAVRSRRSATFSSSSGGAVTRPTRSSRASSGVSSAQRVPGPAAEVSASYSPCGAAAIGTTRPCTPSTASRSGERVGATATTVQPRRYACSARRARPGSEPSAVAIRSRSTEPAQPGRAQRRAPGAGATPVGWIRTTGAAAPASAPIRSATPDAAVPGPATRTARGRPSGARLPMPASAACRAAVRTRAPASAAPRSRSRRSALARASGASSKDSSSMAVGLRITGWGAGCGCGGLAGGRGRGRVLGVRPVPAGSACPAGLARARFARGQAGRRASSTRRTGMPSRTG